MILVTGGAGYVGSHFIRRHVQTRPQEELLIIDNLARGYSDSLLNSAHVKFVHCNIADRSILDSVLSKHKIDAVVHFAAYAYVGESHEKPFLYFQNNVIQSLQFFETLAAHQISKIVFSSSCATYGEPLYSPLDEEHVQNPTNIYGRTKLMIEQVLKSLGETLNWSSISLRYFNAAGADQNGLIGESHEPETHLIPIALHAAKHDKVVKVNGNDYPTRDGTCIRDYVHVNDLADAHCQALDYLQAHKEPVSLAINLGTTTGATVLEVLTLCEQITGKPIKKVIGPRRPGDPAALVANASKAEKILGWQPKYDLKTTIETAWKWEQNRRY